MVSEAGTSVAACLPAVHGRDGDRHVPLPRPDRVDDEVQVLGLAQTLEIGLAARVAGRLGLPGGGHQVLPLHHAIFNDVANRLDLDPFQVQQNLQQHRPAPADPHEPDPHLVHRLHIRSITREDLLTDGPRRCRRRSNFQETSCDCTARS